MTSVLAAHRWTVVVFVTRLTPLQLLTPPCSRVAAASSAASAVSLSTWRRHIFSAISVVPSWPRRTGGTCWASARREAPGVSVVMARCCTCFVSHYGHHFKGQSHEISVWCFFSSSNIFSWATVSYPKAFLRITLNSPRYCIRVHSWLFGVYNAESK